MAGLNLYGTKHYNLLLNDKELEELCLKAYEKNGIKTIHGKTQDGKNIVTFSFHNCLLMKPQNIKDFDTYTEQFIDEETLSSHLLTELKNNKDNKYLSNITDLRLYKFKKYKDHNGNIFDHEVFDLDIFYFEEKEKLKKDNIEHILSQNLNENRIDELLNDNYLQNILQSLYLLKKKEYKYDTTLKETFFPHIYEYINYLYLYQNNLTNKDLDLEFEVSIKKGMQNSLKLLLNKIFSSKGGYSYQRYIYLEYIKRIKKPTIPTKVYSDCYKEINKKNKKRT